ncbi:hypothetical protein [Salinisphaera orenii]|uniref:hypothetical protein n=1 Tax=Salinisphaera orenii TaxID=856731 RepID=UPI0011CD7CAE|nr:hypothetical protein [Salinisphaera halophila]
MSESNGAKFERAFLLFKLDRLRSDFEIGDPSARYEALRLCIRHSYPIPDWLAYLEDLDAAVALGDASYVKQGGQRSTLTRAKEIKEKRMIAAALEACSHAGLKGEAKRAKASQLLEEFGIYRAPTTLHSPKTIEPTIDEYEPFREKLGINIGLGGFLIEDDDFRLTGEEDR